VTVRTVCPSGDTVRLPTVRLRISQIAEQVDTVHRCHAAFVRHIVLHIVGVVREVVRDRRLKRDLRALAGQRHGGDDA
jgi:hypothetical protein